MDESFDVCVITTGHLSTNPRMVKEVEAIVEAGYRVRVIACKYLQWANDADHRTLDVDSHDRLKITFVKFGPLSGFYRRNTRRFWQRFALLRCAKKKGELDPWLAAAAIHPATLDVLKEACKVRARLFIAHNLAALPAAFTAAQKSHARLGFDAEDFHSGEFDESDQAASVTFHCVQRVEEHFLPLCNYVSAAANGIGERYAQLFGIEKPTTILNVFPRSHRDALIAEESCKLEKPIGTISLFWFSQTIGPKRGLEYVMRALQYLPTNVILSLRGKWANGYREQFMLQAQQAGVRNRILELPVCPPDELVARCKLHDIGIAFEIPHCENRDLCVSNKLFTYVLAGLPCIATNTRGQSEFGKMHPDVIQVIENPTDAHQLAADIEKLIAGLELRRSAAEELARVYCWDEEKVKFLSLVTNELKT